ncbi:hypothetical protein Droror1_Dr00018276 [Drosera rotundifolia]
MATRIFEGETMKGARWGIRLVIATSDRNGRVMSSHEVKDGGRLNGMDSVPTKIVAKVVVISDNLNSVLNGLLSSIDQKLQEHKTRVKTLIQESEVRTEMKINQAAVKVDNFDFRLRVLLKELNTQVKQKVEEPESHLSSIQGRLIILEKRERGKILRIGLEEVRSQVNTVVHDSSFIKSDIYTINNKVFELKERMRLMREDTTTISGNMLNLDQLTSDTFRDVTKILKCITGSQPSSSSQPHKP